MKSAGVIIEILLMVLAGIGFVVCLLLPAMMNSRIDFQEEMPGLIPAVIVFFPALVLTIISAIFVLKSKKAAQNLS